MLINKLTERLLISSGETFFYYKSGKRTEHSDRLRY